LEAIDFRYCPIQLAQGRDFIFTFAASDRGLLLKFMKGRLADFAMISHRLLGISLIEL
jgi:hypothetical protein